MSVTVIAHFPVADIAKAIAGLQANAALLEEITEDTKSGGIIHHTFVAGEAELVVIDEWETAEQFQSFFEGNAKVREDHGDYWGHWASRRCHLRRSRGAWQGIGSVPEAS